MNLQLIGGMNIWMNIPSRFFPGFLQNSRMKMNEGKAEDSEKICVISLIFHLNLKLISGKL